MPTASSRRAGYRSRRMIVLMSMMVPDLFAECIGIRIQTSNVLIKSRLLTALMMMNNRNRRILSRSTWWSFHRLAAIEWGDPNVQATCCRKIRSMLCCNNTSKQA